MTKDGIARPAISALISFEALNLRQLMSVLLALVLLISPLPAQELRVAAKSQPPLASKLVQDAVPRTVEQTADSAQATSGPFAVAGLSVSVGFADSSAPSASFPAPWQGASNTVFLGGGTVFHAGALRLDNASSVPISIDRVQVDLGRPGPTFDLWGKVTIPANGSAILTQTADGNFSTNGYPLVACGAALPPNETRIPTITVTAAGQSTVFSDSAHILDTGGFDLTCRGNASLGWRRIGTTGITNSGPKLSLAPDTSALGGNRFTAIANLADAAGQALPNAFIGFKVLSGPNAGTSGQAVTDSQGNASFTWPGSAQGVDVLQASLTTATDGVVKSGTQNVTWSSAGCTTSSGSLGNASSLIYVGAARGPYGSVLSLAARLTDALGSPLSGRSLVFIFAGQSLTAITDATGVARSSVPLSVTPGTAVVTVNFADPSAPAQTTQTIVVDRAPTTIRYTGSTLLGTATPQTVTAVLLGPDGKTPIPNKTVSFTIGSVQVTGVTNAAGVATTTMALTAPETQSGLSSLKVAFAGDVFYAPAYTANQIIVYLSTSFAIWGANTGGLAIGQRVNFWGAQWASQVRQGDYDGNASFKGFADPVAQVHLCQATATSKTLTAGCWTSKSGQSFPPPLAVPAYIEVIVSTAVVKQGSEIFGNIASAVVVKVDPQPAYGPDPGKPGYGTIVAVIEDSNIFPNRAALTVSQTQTSPVSPGQRVDVAIQTTNPSTTPATNVSLSLNFDQLQPIAGNTVSLGTLAGGSSVSSQISATVPTIPTRSGAESSNDYITRLSAMNGRAYTVTTTATFSDGSNQPYLPVQANSLSILQIPVLTLALFGPASVAPGARIPYTVVVSNIGGATATAGSVAVRLPDGSITSVDVSGLAPGATIAGVASYQQPTLAPLGNGETTAQYLARLSSYDGKLLTSSATLNWRDAVGNTYGDVGQQTFSSTIRVPVLNLSGVAPPQLAPSQLGTLNFTVQNTGGCTATLTNLTVTNPDATTSVVAPFPLTGGQSSNVQTTWRVTGTGRSQTDSDAVYLGKLAALSNQPLNFNAQLQWGDPSGGVYGPIPFPLQSREVLPVLSLALTAPATASSGSTIAYGITLTNTGSAAATTQLVSLTLPDGSIQRPATTTLPPGGSFTTSVNYNIPNTQPSGMITGTATLNWTDASGNGYGSLTTAANTNVINTVSFNSLTLSPASAGPNVIGTSQLLTATLKDQLGNPIPSSTVQFTVTGANPTTGNANTDSSGVATFTLVGANAGTDSIQATSGSAVSNRSTVSWLVPVQKISTTTVFGRFFASNGSGTFNTPPTATPAFTQIFPTINFNPPAGTVPGNTSGVGVFTRPFTNVTTDVNGNFTGTIVAQGNGLQAGAGTLFDFQAVFVGTFTVSGPGDVRFDFFSDDGFIFGIGNGATRVSGADFNRPPFTPFNSLPTMGAFNTATAPVANSITVHFPAAGSYPYELDYSECCAGQLAFTMTAAGQGGSTGVPPSGNLSLSPNNPPGLQTGQTQTFTALAADAAGTALAGIGVALTVNGPNSQQINARTDSTGRATLTYIGANPGTDALQAVASVAGLAAFSNTVNMTWTGSPTGGGGGSGGGPGGTIGVTQGWIGQPASGVQINSPTPIKLGTGITLRTGVVDLWPVQNPLAVTVLNPTASGGAGATLATFDPSLVANGSYIVRLQGTASDGSTLTSLILLEVTGENKPGRFTRTVTDLRVPLSGMPISVTRTYDSVARFNRGDFGQGWSLTVGVQLDVSPSNDVTFTLNGQRITFAFRPQSQGFPFYFFFTPQYVAGPGATGKLTADGCSLLVNSSSGFLCFLDFSTTYKPTTYTYTDPYGRAYTIGADGSLKQIRDLNGVTLTIGPNGITSSVGNMTVPFQRDALGRITQITDPQGRPYIYQYSAAGDLTSVTLPGVTGNVAYGYTTDHLLNRETDPRGNSASSTYYTDGRLQSVRDPLGNVTQYAYDLTNNIVTKTNPDGGIVTTQNDASGNAISIRDPLGRINTFTYDGNHNMLTSTNALGKVTRYTYDSFGNLTSKTDPLGHGTTKVYDSIGRLQTVTDALNQVKVLQHDPTGHTTRISDTLGQLFGATWDANGNRTSVTLANGATAQFTYDAFGRPIGIVDHGGFTTSRGYDAFGRPTTASDPRHGTMTQTYDAAGNYTGRTDPAGNSVVYAYDADGNRTSEADMNGNRRNHVYDALGRRTQTTWPDGTVETMTYDYAGRALSRIDTSGHTTSLGYDKAGQLLSVTSAGGTPDASTIAFAYDQAGRRTTLTDPRGKSLTLTYDDADRTIAIRDASGAVWSFGYDANNQMTSVLDSNNLRRAIQYDVRGRPTQMAHPDGTTVKYSYDALTLKSTTDQAGKTKSYTYDTRGEIASVTDGVGNKIQYTRDAVGNLIGVQDGRGNTTSYDYDNADRMIKKTLPDGSFEQYTYNGMGQLASVRLTDGNTNRYKYDTRNRLIEIDYFNGSTASFTYTPEGKRKTATTAAGTVQYAYDNLERLTRITQPNGQFVAYTYDKADNVTSVSTSSGTTQNTWDDANRLTSVIDPSGGVTTYQYDGGGRLVTRRLPNGVATDYGYDTNGRLINLAHRQGTGAPFRSFRYTLGAAGNRQAVVETDGSQTNWTYDDAYRLTHETSVDGLGATNSDIAYTYDAAGNRTSKTVNGSTTSYGYNNLDQITSAGTAQYSYDARGNLTRVVGGGSNSNFAWDPANRLASYTSSSGNSSLYGYDADGRWTSQTAGGATHSFVWDESTPFGDIAQEVDALGAPIANYSRGGSEMVGKFAGGAASYYLHDALGSVVGLTNSTGAVTDQYRYDAYGNVTSSQGSTVNPYGYRGQRVDAISSLQQLRARWFEPGAGRFLSRDTMDYELDNPVDLNRYGYAAANPINSYDPTGHSDLVEYGIIARETEELAIIEGYLIGRRDEALISCVADVLLAMLAREFLSGGWVGLPNVITVAFGHLVKAPLDAAGKDWMVTRELLLAKAAMFESAPREWTMALSGIRFRIPKVFTDGLNFFVGRLGVRLVSDQQSTPDPCNNHAEQKLLRDANPPLQTLLSVGASRPVCVNCAMQLLPWVDCFGPIGSNMRCVQ